MGDTAEPAGGGSTLARRWWGLISLALSMCLLISALVSTALAAGPETTQPASSQAASSQAAASQGGTSTAVVIRLQGEIDDYAARVLTQHIDRARTLGAAAIIFDINTPGGALGPTLELTQKVRSLTDIKTVAYINPKAYSAGTIFAVACDEIYVSPDSALGDCAPIMVTEKGLETLGDAERAKVSSPVVADMKASADRNGYDPELLAAMVLPKRVVHVLVGPDGTRKIADEEEVKALKADGYKPMEGLADPLDGPDTLLTLSGSDAVKVGLARAKSVDTTALAAEKGWAVVETLEPTPGQRVVQWLNSAAVRGVVATAFLISLYLSFQIPGHGLPEAVCLTALATLIVVPVMTGYAGWLEIVLILAGIALVALELFVVTGTIVPGVVGAVLVLFGLVLTFVPTELPPVPGDGGKWHLPSLPALPQTWDALQTGVTVVLLSSTAAIAAILVLSRFLPALPVGRRLVLTGVAGEGGVGGMAGPAGGDGSGQTWPPVGAVATAVTDLRPGGNAEFPDPAGGGTRVVAVVSDSGFVSRGARLRVREVEGPKIVVREIRPAADSPDSGGGAR